RIADAVVARAVVRVVQVVDDLRAGRPGTRAVRVRVLDDDVDPGAAAPGGRLPGRGRAEHHQPVPEAVLGVVDRAVVARVQRGAGGAEGRRGALRGGGRVVVDE